MITLIVVKLFVSAVATVIIELISVWIGAPMPWVLAAIVAIVLVFFGAEVVGDDDDWGL